MNAAYLHRKQCAERDAVAVNSRLWKIACSLSNSANHDASPPFEPSARRLVCEGNVPDHALAALKKEHAGPRPLVKDQSRAKLFSLAVAASHNEVEKFDIVLFHIEDDVLEPENSRSRVISSLLTRGLSTIGLRPERWGSQAAYRTIRGRWGLSLNGRIPSPLAHCSIQRHTEGSKGATERRLEERPTHRVPLISTGLSFHHQRQYWTL